ncbi:hypothetical protein CCACVL1_01958 [Corchorus capsularis]|uniref:Uncharacterized protein n=1 Tax=Corchorus capsularis TaxID=210143 RepID=A0A1R3KE52_COCAP|nr:hypothetical protein CCACVL1_01958 [Corchorus capsularis]
MVRMLVTWAQMNSGTERPALGGRTLRKEMAVA